MWACALGHMDAAVVLYKWDRRAISIPDSLGRLPLAIARSRGHVKLAECLEQLQRDEQTQLGQNPRIQCPSSTDSSTESWVSQWHSELIASQEPQKGVTVISSTNTGKKNPTALFADYVICEILEQGAHLGGRCHQEPCCPCLIIFCGLSIMRSVLFCKY